MDEGTGMIDKEKPPAGPRERLAMVEDALGELAHQYDVEYVPDDGGSVYVNYDFSAAITIELGEDDQRDMYVVQALHWAPDHGIDDEHFIGVLADADIAAQVAVQFARSRERM